MFEDLLYTEEYRGLKKILSHPKKISKIKYSDLQLHFSAVEFKFYLNGAIRSRTTNADKFNTTKLKQLYQNFVSILRCDMLLKDKDR